MWTIMSGACWGFKRQIQGKQNRQLTQVGMFLDAPQQQSIIEHNGDLWCNHVPLRVIWHEGTKDGKTDTRPCRAEHHVGSQCSQRWACDTNRPQKNSFDNLEYFHRSIVLGFGGVYQATDRDTGTFAWPIHARCWSIACHNLAIFHVISLWRRPCSHCSAALLNNLSCVDPVL